MVCVCVGGGGGVKSVGGGGGGGGVNSKDPRFFAKICKPGCSSTAKSPERSQQNFSYPRRKHLGESINIVRILEK